MSGDIEDEERHGGHYIETRYVMQPETEKQRLERIATAVLAAYCSDGDGANHNDAKFAEWAVAQARFCDDRLVHVVLLVDSVLGAGAADTVPVPLVYQTDAALSGIEAS